VTRVVIAHEARELREAAHRIVRELGWDAAVCSDGHEALAEILATPTPEALVIDVALPGRAAYEVVEEIRGRELPVKVVLVASVYSKTAYKRRPTSLYGADDYVEQHHITDFLGEKLAHLLGVPPGPHKDQQDPLSLSDEEREELVRIRAAAEAQLEWPKGGGQSEAVRIARVIVCDLLLYNGAVVADALVGAGVADVERHLARDLDAARALLGACVPAEVMAGGDLVAEALVELLRRVEERHQRLHAQTRTGLREADR
jgi:CheY-like chemotaxis protein